MIIALVALSMVTVGMATAMAGHGDAALPGSTFEIDDNANLKNDDGAGSVDWANLAHPNGPELRATDKPTGQTDDSYKGGSKEDTQCPGEVTGSIPNNKSDLLTFHVYEEADAPGFLNLAWSRVSDPSGTTLMDFEFNQSTTACPQGPNVVRTDGDLLIEYAIDQGGARANITGRFWNAAASAWGPPLDLDQPSPTCGGNPCAVGTINNTSAIPAAESDGLIASGSKALRTFGEAQIDLDLIFQPNKCSSFGSAMLKSRSSDSFTSQLKDFIRPIPIDLQNCGNVIIRKQTIPDEDPNTTTFGYTKAFPTDPATGNTFSLTDDGVKNFQDDVLFGTGYTVAETSIPAGWEFVSVDCSASTGVTPTISGTLVTFDIDADTDVLDCTYTNRAKASLTVVKQTINDTGSFDFTSSTLTPAAFTLTTTDEGAAGQDSRQFGDLTPGTYDVAESTPPPGWEPTSATCDNGDAPNAVSLAAGDDVTCTFVNTATADLTITKVTNVKTGAFDFASGTLTPDAWTLTTTDTGAAGSDSRDFADLAPGTYDAAETVPTGWNLVSQSCDNGDAPASITLATGDDVECTFVNAPQEGAVKIVKTRKHAADGPGDHPHEGVTFTVSGGSLTAPEEVVTDANGEACVDGVLLSQFDGDYTVVETLPGGYAADQALSQDVTVTAESTCGDGDEAVVTFGNTPLTDVTVSVDSQVDGGTSTVVACWSGTDTSGDPDYTVTTDPLAPDNGDGSVDAPNLLPTDPEVTLTCQITVDP